MWHQLAWRHLLMSVINNNFLTVDIYIPAIFVTWLKVGIQTNPLVTLFSSILLLLNMFFSYSALFFFLSWLGYGALAQPLEESHGFYPLRVRNHARAGNHVRAVAASSNSTSTSSTNSSSNSNSNCFPALGFKMPATVPSTTDNWWCDPSTEYAFLGFSYEVTACLLFFFIFIFVVV